MKKRTIATGLVTLLSIVTLAACSKTNQNSKNNQTSTTNGTKTTANSGSATTVGQGIKAAVTEDEMNVGIYGIGAVAAGGIAVWCLKRKKKKI